MEVESVNNKSIYLKAFNNQFIEFLDDIDRIIPNNADIITMKNALTRLKKANPKLILTMWYKWVVTQYGDKVDSGDYEFFINKDYKADWEGYKHEGPILDAIDRMRTIVRDCDDNNKETALQYVKNLCGLSKMYIE